MVLNLAEDRQAQQINLATTQINCASAEAAESKGYKSSEPRVFDPLHGTGEEGEVCFV